MKVFLSLLHAFIFRHILFLFYRKNSTLFLAYFNITAFSPFNILFKLL